MADNTATTSGSDATGAFTSQGHNLIGVTDGSSGWVGSDLTGTTASPLNPLLAPLGDYGGPNETMALLPGSAAIGAGVALFAINTDQRGLARPTSGSADIGAFESSGFTVTVTSGSGQSTGIGSAFPAPLVVTVTANNPSEPVAGGLVTFTPPTFGASAALSESVVTIGATGTASVMATANATAGSYAVSASAIGATSSASFYLTNSTGQPGGGTSQPGGGTSQPGGGTSQPGSGTHTVLPAPALVDWVSIQRFNTGRHKAVQGIVLQFDEALDSVAAEYKRVCPGHDPEEQEAEEQADPFISSELQFFDIHGDALHQEAARGRTRVVAHGRVRQRARRVRTRARRQ